MNTIETHVLEMIGEDTTSPDVFTDTSEGMLPIRDSINDAIEEICMVTGCYAESYYISLRQNRNFYKFDFKENSIAWIKDVWIVTQKRRLEQTDIPRLNSFNPRWLDNTGTPEAYFPIGIDAIGVWPAPASDTDILELSVIAIPQRYDEDTDRIKLRKNWDWAAAHYAVGEYYASRGDAKTAVYHHNNYLSKLGINIKYPKSSEYIPYFKSEKEPWPKETG